jgi:DNA modification methylase
MTYKIINGSSLEELKKLPEKSINMCMTSPPYWALRDYGVEGQLGTEETFDKYISDLCDIFDGIKRVLRDDGTCWVNLGDTYSGTGSKGSYRDPKYEEGRNGQSVAINNNTGLPSKCLTMIPMRFAIEMVNRGWILRNTLIWHKPNAMPSSVKDRFTVDFEYIFLFSKNKKYYFKQQLEPYTSPLDRWGGENVSEYSGKFSNKDDNENYNSPRARCSRPNYPERERILRPNPNGKNKRTTWSINTKPYKEAHFAVYPEKLCETPIMAGCPDGGVVIDPFAGAGTTGLVAEKQGKNSILIELNSEYCKIIKNRLDTLNDKDGMEKKE